MAIGALPFLMSAFPKYEIAIFGVPEWPGFVKGFDVSVLDLIVVAVYINLPRTQKALPFRLSFIFYICAVLLSVLQAPNPTAAFYYVWQLLRMFLTYAVVARLCVDLRLASAVLKGMALGLCFQACVVIWQRFGLHYISATGTFQHQNLLGVMTHFAVFPFFALLLSGKKDWQSTAVPMAGLLIYIFTASRASLGFAAVGCLFLFLLSALRRWTAKKARILLAAVLALAVLSPVAYRQLELRFSVYQLGENTEGGRTALNNAAEIALYDNPLGIGANNFIVVANVQGYYERAGVGFKNTTTSPHNAYWTTAAETGYIGLLAFLIFLLCPMLVALSCGWYNRKDKRGDLLLGLATSLIIVYVHSYFEWVFLTDLVQYAFAIEIGIIAALAQQLGYWSPFRTIDQSSKFRSSADSKLLISRRQSKLRLQYLLWPLAVRRIGRRPSR
jgi:O-antigen ligase